MAKNNTVKCLNQAGFGLVETLIATALIAILFLPIMATQLWQARHCYQNYFRATAVLQAQSMLERLRANHSAEARTREYVNWNIWNQKFLPQGHGSYTCREYDHQCLVSISWWSGKKQAYALSAQIH